MTKVRIPWTRAGAEFIAILAGVTLALLAEDWRQYKNEREEERIALQEILRDLEADSVALDKMLQLARAQSGAAFWAQENFGKDISSDSALERISLLGSVELYQPVRSGYVGLRDSGRLALVLNGDLRRKIVSYYEAQQTYIQQLESIYIELGWGFTEKMMEDVLLVLEDSLARPPLPPSFHRTLRRPWWQVSNDFEFQTKATYLGAVAWNFGTRVYAAMEENQRLKVGIAQELETRLPPGMSDSSDTKHTG